MMTVTLENQTFPVRATMRAWRKFERATGVKVSEIDGKDVTIMPELLYYFVQEGCKKQNMDFKMEVDDFLGLISVADLEGIGKVIEECMSVGEKKTTPTKTTPLLNGTK